MLNNLDQNKIIEMSKVQTIKKQKGASMIEYALVVAAVVGVGAVIFGGNVGSINKAVQDKAAATATAINPS